MADSPIVRDTLSIDATLQGIYDSYRFVGPFYLLARVVQHIPGFSLKLNETPLIIIADHYDANGGNIDGSGWLKNPVQPARGADGVDGANAQYRSFGTVTHTIHHINGTSSDPSGITPSASPSVQVRPVTPGTNGTSGKGGSSGSPGTDVTLLCRTAGSININVQATESAPGGNAGRGGEGGDGSAGYTDPDTGEVIGAFPGTHGGYGGAGGNGGNGASGGVITILSTSPLPGPSLMYGGTPGSAGGRGAPWGRDGNECGNPICTDETQPCHGRDGTYGSACITTQPVIQVLSAEEYRSRMLTLLVPDPVNNPGWNLASYWHPFRAVVGEYYFRQFQPEDEGNNNGVLAAREFEATLELRSDNPEALRLNSFLLAGTNAIGQPRNMDVVPDFNRYIDSYNSIASLVTSFFDRGVAEILAGAQLDAVRQLLVDQKQTAADAVATATSDIGLATQEQKNATDEVTYVHAQLQQATTDIQTEMEAMKAKQFSLLGVLGTVAQLGAAVIGIAGAAFSGGASLALLVPAIASLSSEVLKDGPDIVQTVFAGKKADTDAIDKAYKKVGKSADAVIAAGKSIVNFVSTIQKLTDGTTPDNAKYVTLVRRGSELTHQLLVAKSQVDLIGGRISAVQAHLGRAQGLLDTIQRAESNGLDAGLVRSAGEQAIDAALSQADTLNSFAFLAQRSFEIYTIPPPPQLSPQLSAGLVHPDVLRSYQDGLPGSEAAMVAAYQAAWKAWLGPVALQRAYADYLQRDVQTDIVRLVFTAAADAGLLQSLRTSSVLPFHIDVAALSIDQRETKIRGVAVSLVGATSSSSIISCDVWHDGRYEQIGPDGGRDVQFLRAKTYTVQAPVVPLTIDPVHFGSSDPIDAPQGLSYWGRGIGGNWELRLPGFQPGHEPINLSGLQTVQIWIGYQYVKNV